MIHVFTLDIVDKIIYGGVQIYTYNVKGGKNMENENVSNQYSTKKNKPPEQQINP